MTHPFNVVRAFGVMLCLFWHSQNLLAQGTAFTYQGQLTSGGAALQGQYDFVFSTYDAAVSGAFIAGPVTNANVPVTNGLFLTAIDFGPGVFTGPGRWMEIAVRTNGPGPFNALSPRQAVTPTPYAIHAGSVNAAGISGTISSNMLAPGAALGNLVASGQSSVASGGVILSSNQNATTLLSQGYTRLGGVVDFSWQDCTGPRRQRHREHTAVWTGFKMIVWGGFEVSGPPPANNAEMYDPAANTWQSVTTNNAPASRYQHTAVWTGSEMIVWGGNFAYFGSVYTNNGGRYNPATDTWQPVTTNNGPIARGSHTAVWTGSEMIVWGGNATNGVMNSGARYNPTTDTWLPLSTNNAPTPRVSHTAVWTGDAMVVWGGTNATGVVNSGARYNPVTDTWTSMTTNGAPSGRAYHSAVWTGSRMIVWGGKGFNEDVMFNDGCLYDPTTDAWSPMTTNSAPILRNLHSAIWTGTEMIVWGGSWSRASSSTVTTYLNDGGRYNPGNDSWLNVTLAESPVKRRLHTAVWTGTEMLIVGGVHPEQSGPLDDCYSYAPSRVMYLYLRQ